MARLGHWSTASQRQPAVPACAVTTIELDLGTFVSPTNPPYIKAYNNYVGRFILGQCGHLHNREVHPPQIAPTCGPLGTTANALVGGSARTSCVFPALFYSYAHRLSSIVKMIPIPTSHTPYLREKNQSKIRPTFATKTAAFINTCNSCAPVAVSISPQSSQGFLCDLTHSPGILIHHMNFTRTCGMHARSRYHILSKTLAAW
jgi:hypothetical protein